jgi:hypothetical protein
MPRQASAWILNGVTITDAMSRAGATRLNELRPMDVDLFYVAQEVFLAMMGAQTEAAQECCSPHNPQALRNNDRDQNSTSKSQ